MKNLTCEEYNKICDEFMRNFKFTTENYHKRKFDKLIDTAGKPFKVFIIDDKACDNEDYQKGLNDILKKVVNADMYAFDWNHGVWIFNPKENITLQQSGWAENLDGKVLYPGFPCYYPNGDDFFFVSRDFKQGILAFPGFGEEYALLYVVGQKLVDEFEKQKDNLFLYDYSLEKMDYYNPEAVVTENDLKSVDTLKQELFEIFKANGATDEDASNAAQKVAKVVHDNAKKKIERIEKKRKNK